MFLLIFLLIPLPITIVSYDTGELNHYYDDNGKLVFDQLILWDTKLDNDGKEYELAQAWFLVDKKTMVTPTHSILVKNITLYKVNYKFYRETWGQIDPVAANRALIPNVERRKIE